MRQYSSVPDKYAYKM